MFCNFLLPSPSKASLPVFLWLTFICLSFSKHYQLITCCLKDRTHLFLLILPSFIQTESLVISCLHFSFYFISSFRKRKMILGQNLKFKRKFAAAPVVLAVWQLAGLPDFISKKQQSQLTYFSNCFTFPSLSIIISRDMTRWH